jgi:cytochrome c oxidase subunit 2
MLFFTILIFRKKANFFYYSRFKNFYQNLNHCVVLEIIWTLLPALFTGKLCLASFALTYSLDCIDNPKINFIITGNQWYWTYELHHKIEGCPEFFDVRFDSYMVQEEDLKFGQFRLLEVDNELVVPYNVELSLEFTSNDVIHSWAVPSLGIKVDCIPGRINRVGLTITREGTFYGQCSELCGVKHAFMPIKVVAVDNILWHFWLYCLSEKNFNFFSNLFHLGLRNIDTVFSIRAEDVFNIYNGSGNISENLSDGTKLAVVFSTLAEIIFECNRNLTVEKFFDEYVDELVRISTTILFYDKNISENNVDADTFFRMFSACLDVVFKNNKNTTTDMFLNGGLGELIQAITVILSGNKDHFGGDTVDFKLFSKLFCAVYDLILKNNKNFTVENFSKKDFDKLFSDVFSVFLSVRKGVDK